MSAKGLYVGFENIIKSNKKVSKNPMFKRAFDNVMNSSASDVASGVTDNLKGMGNLSFNEIASGLKESGKKFFSKGDGITNATPNDMIKSFSNSKLKAGLVNNKKALKVAGAVGVGAGAVGAGVGISNMNDDKKTNY